MNTPEQNERNEALSRIWALHVEYYLCVSRWTGRFVYHHHIKPLSDGLVDIARTNILTTFSKCLVYCHGNTSIHRVDTTWTTPFCLWYQFDLKVLDDGTDAELITFGITKCHEKSGLQSHRFLINKLKIKLKHKHCRYELDSKSRFYYLYKFISGLVSSGIKRHQRSSKLRSEQYCNNDNNVNRKKKRYLKDVTPNVSV